MKPRITTARHLETDMPNHISEVKNGIKCMCVCYECNKQLIAANNGKIQEHHFKHKIISDCKGSPETGLHMLAKRILIESNRILISSNEYFDFQSSIEEKGVMDIIPDVQIFNSKNKYWLIEIAVTHFVDIIKLDKLKRLNVNCLEINLKDVDRYIGINELKEKVLNELNVRKVLTREVDVLQTNKSSEGKDDNIIQWILGGAIVIIGIRWLIKKR